MASRNTHLFPDERTAVREKLLAMVDNDQVDELIELVVALFDQAKDPATTLVDGLQDFLRRLPDRLRDKLRATPNDFLRQTTVTETQQGSRNAECCPLVQKMLRKTEDARIRDIFELSSLIGRLDEREIRLVLELRPREGREIVERLRAHEIVQVRNGGLSLVPRCSRVIVDHLRLHELVRARGQITRMLPILEANLGRAGRARVRALGQLCTLVGNAPLEEAGRRLSKSRVARARDCEIEDALERIKTVDGRVSRGVAARLVSREPASLGVLHGVTGVEGALLHIDIGEHDGPSRLRGLGFDGLRSVVDGLRPFVASRPLRVTRVFLRPEDARQVCHAFT
ncbi:MAG TPA: hypothetical protein PK156_43450, partial [Polyangium sp.]|nr:hypothetical protein [Polyangium sp.]